MADVFKKGRLFIGNAVLARQLLRVRNPSTGLLQTWDGGSTVTCRISATPTGGAISGLGPFTMAVDTGGAYSYTIPSGAIATALDSATYHGTLVYLIVEGGAGGEYRGVRPLEVVPVRYVS